MRLYAGPPNNKTDYKPVGKWRLPACPVSIRTHSQSRALMRVHIIRLPTCTSLGKVSASQRVLRVGDPKNESFIRNVKQWLAVYVDPAKI